MSLDLNPDAILIADSHFSAKARGILDYLDLLLDSPPSQLILMGDIAQVLLGNLKSSIKSNLSLLTALNRLETKGVQIIWFEGNHDFFLHHIKQTKLLKQTIFIPRTKQPTLCAYQNKSYLLAHGDLFLSSKYELYIKTLTNIPKLLQVIDYLSAGEIYLEIESKLTNKPIKQHPFHFFEFASSRIEAYKEYSPTPFDGIIEGHFHIGKKLELYGIQYISLPSFYFEPKGIEIQTVLK
ncbi:metallophosphoesterase [Helicobacter pametensis]|uniref:metallophosphoesterase n=1 Tax=Helicobacter pametensis TaxID=95149 RepID=UPI0004B6C8B5|nr:metallophosphoesterase [Helicobacter pametensis]